MNHVLLDLTQTYFNRAIALAYCFGEMAPFTAIMDAIYLLFSAIYNALLCASGHSPEYKIEEWSNFALSHASLYLADSDDE